VTTLPAPTMEFFPIFALFRMTAWMPMSEPSPDGAAVQHHLVAHRHVVADREGHAESACSTEPSWMLLFLPMRIFSVSPRTTHWYQTLAFSAISTWPITSALSATQAPLSSFGAMPSSS
jgi:hypothetical protein